MAVATLVGAALIGQALGLVLGSRLHAELPPGAARRTDPVAGALVGVVGVVVVLWILLPTLAHVRGWTSEQARSSRIAREVADHPRTYRHPGGAAPHHGRRSLPPGVRRPAPRTGGGGGAGGNGLSEETAGGSPGPR